MTHISTDPTPPRTALLYVRAPRIGDAPSVQLQALRQRAAQCGWKVASEYLDTATSGFKQRDALLAEIRRGAHPHAALVTPAISQLTTSVRDAVQILDDLVARGGALVTADGIDTATSANKNELTTLIGALAVLGRAGVAERARAALDQARRDGKQIGRKKIPVPIQKVRDLLDAGQSWREISRATGVSVATLHRAIRSTASNAAPLALVEAA